jgi:hypothetical protein
MNNLNIPKLDFDPLTNLIGPKKSWWERLREAMRRTLNPTLDELAASATPEDEEALKALITDIKKEPAVSKNSVQLEGANKEIETEGLKGFRYFERASQSGRLMENLDMPLDLIALLKDHYFAKQHNCQSIIEKLNLDPKNILDIAVAAFGEISYQTIGEYEIISWFSQKTVDPMKLVFYQIMHCQDTDSAKKIDAAIEKLNSVIEQEKFAEVKAFLLTKKINAVNYNDAIANKAFELAQLIKSNPDEGALLDGRDKILKNIRPVSSDVKRFNISTATAPLSIPAQPQEEAKKTIDFLQLIKRDDIKAARAFLQKIEDAFESADKGEFDRDWSAKFDNQKAIDIRARLQAEFPGLNLGKLLQQVNNPDNSDDLLKLIADKLGITDIDTLIDCVNEIFVKIAEIYPDL